MRVPEHVPKSNKVPNKISLELVYYFLQILKHSPILLFASLSKSTNRTNNEPHKWLDLEYIYNCPFQYVPVFHPDHLQSAILSLKSLLKAYMLHHVYEGQCHKEASKKFPREIKRKATHFQI